jgi:phosphomannomutase
MTDPTPGAAPSRLEFGTAGIRGPLGDGPGQLNVGAVRTVADGLALHLLATDAEAPRRGVVVGHDARHWSYEFAHVVADRLVRAGIDVKMFDAAVPTPLVARAVTQLGAGAGLVVTASHNPATDNGLKVYGPDGVLLSAPADEQVAAAVARVADGVEAPARSPLPGSVEHLGTAEGNDPVAAAFVRDALELAGPGTGATPLVATTALHGVGGALLDRLLIEAGVEHVTVAEQFAPDPDFPTVPFPNPEEPHVMDLVVRLAEHSGAEVALANDPDADRVAVALRQVDDGEQSYWMLTGDDVGALLAHEVLRAGREVPAALVATTLVSSRLVPAMATAAGVESVVTPTGFKWLCRAAVDRPGSVQLLAYEEALGYAIGPGTTDKDGITTALVVVRALERLRRWPDQPLSEALRELFDELARRFGAHRTRNGSVRLGVPAGPVIARLRGTATVAGRGIVTEDEPAPGAVRWMLDDDTRVIVRGSGTEPKVKFYVEARVPVSTHEGDVGAAWAESARRAQLVAAAVEELLRSAANRD